MLTSFCTKRRENQVLHCHKTRRVIGNTEERTNQRQGLLKFHLYPWSLCIYNPLCALKQVTRDTHLYLKDIEEREEGGTPAIVESIRAGMVFQLKQVKIQ